MKPYTWFLTKVAYMDREVQFLLYNMPEDSGKVQVIIKDETIWCTQKAMAQLFGVGVPAVSKHLKNIFEEGELSPEMTISKMETVINRGKRGEVNEQIDFYNLDAIIAVGYRVNSIKATKFRQWATKILNEYIRKGFAMDDERLKQGSTLFGKDYFRGNCSGAPALTINVTIVYNYDNCYICHTRQRFDMSDKIKYAGLNLTESFKVWKMGWK